MEIIKIEDLSFTYPGRYKKALENINLSVEKGKFVTICGRSGCGKSTLLRLLKSSVSPHGERSGNVLFCGCEIEKLDAKTETESIGFVMQSPENQIVTDKVWHELAFGLESLSCKTEEIRARVSEMASFFGIENWFYKNVSELSGGQKQLLNLASVMVMQPKILILDEPTSQLDPIAASEFLKTLEKINRELAITVIITEHRLEETFQMSDRVVVIDDGKIIADDTPEKIAGILKEKNHDMYFALPTPARVFSSVDDSGICPISIRDGRIWLEGYIKENKAFENRIPKAKEIKSPETVIEMKNVWFRYKKDTPDVIKGLDLKITKGEIFAVVGGNGTGKTTALSLISGINTSYRGEVLIKGKKISDHKNLYNGIMGVLPQNPQSIFMKKTVYLDLFDVLSDAEISQEEKDEKVLKLSKICRIDGLLGFHPYDLSGGEQQRAALCKILLKSPEILLLDEPTKGFDAHFKMIFADILSELQKSGITIVMVSHDIEFCAEYANRCAMFFDGNITSMGEPREFFGGKSFYTTAANRMARTTLKNAVLADDIIVAIGGKNQERKKDMPDIDLSDFQNDFKKEPENKKKKNRICFSKIFFGSIFAAVFLILTLMQFYDADIPGFLSLSFSGMSVLRIISFISVVISFICFFGKREKVTEQIEILQNKRNFSWKNIAAFIFVLVAIPLTIYLGIRFFDDRKYFLISILIILETLIPFCVLFEDRKPKARELVVISVLCALAVSSRAVFFGFPQFKPVVALVIISGVCFGGETGFLVGAITAFVSNFFFGQGPWTPWHMFAFGIIGFLAGILFSKGLLKKTKLRLCILGFLATLLIYGGIMNPASVFMTQNKITKELIITSYITGFPFDMIHALSTVFFLWFISEPMIEKLERIKIKYGLL